MNFVLYFDVKIIGDQIHFLFFIIRNRKGANFYGFM